jgi:hypothetical protein
MIMRMMTVPVVMMVVMIVAAHGGVLSRRQAC